MQYLLGILEHVNKLYRVVGAILRKVGITGIFTERDEQFVRNIDRVLDQIEPRALTLEEVKKLQYIRDGAIWLELFCNGLFPTFPEFSNKSLTFFVAIPFAGYRSTFENDWYGKTWRCWSAKPTDEQREAVPWES